MVKTSNKMISANFHHSEVAITVGGYYLFNLFFEVPTNQKHYLIKLYIVKVAENVKLNEEVSGVSWHRPISIIFIS